jgi:hypothetical protein
VHIGRRYSERVYEEEVSCLSDVFEAMAEESSSPPISARGALAR